MNDYEQFLPKNRKPEDDPYAQFLPQKTTKADSVESTKASAASVESALPEHAWGRDGRISIGAGSMLTDLGLGAKQRLYESIANYQNQLGGINGRITSAMGMPDFNQKSADVAQEVLEKRRMDAPIRATTSGTVGRVLGAAGAAVPTMLIPGAATLGGSMLAGMGMGAIEPTAGDESVVGNTAMGGAGGAAGYGLAKLLGSAGNTLSARNAAQAPTPLQNTINDAIKAGYKFDPASINPTLVNRTLSGAAGKQNLAQRMSIENQVLTNNIAAVDIGLPKGANLTPEALAAAKKGPAQVYEQMRLIGEIPVSGSYASTLNAITQKYAGASKSFNIENPITKVIEPYKVASFDSGAAVDAIGILREEAKGAFRQGNDAIGKAQRAIANALEEEIGNAKAAPPELLSAFKQARTQYAKIHSVENALNEASGNVSAAKIGAEFAKGKPLTGGLDTIGRTQQALQKALATQKGDSMPGISPHDTMAGLIAASASGNPAFLATMFGRPLLQNALLSGPAQRAMVGATSPSNLLPNVLQSRLLKDPLRYGLLGNAPHFAE